MNVKTTRNLGKLIALSLITSTMLQATNGDSLIAVGTKARGMGGVGIALSHGAESGLGNAALITSVESSEVGFGGTIFMPDIETTLNTMGVGDGSDGLPPLQQSRTSDADMNMIPSVSIAHKIDENWYVGIGMWGTAGMGTDYNNNSNFAQFDMGNMDMVTNLQLMQFAVPIAYKTGGLSLAVTPVVQYGNLDIDYNMPVYDAGGVLTDTNRIGAGLAQDFGFGFNLGIAYDFTANGVAGLTVGAIYKSSIEMDYDPQLSVATGPFGADILNGSDKLEQPEEYGVGIAYVMGQHTFAFDYKKIKWSDAEGYGDFGWDDSDVYAVGYAYTENEWTVRLGYNHADSAVVEVADPRLNFFNLLGFPANAEDHYTIGGSYAFSNTFSLDLAYVYADEADDTFALYGMNGFESIKTTHSEDGISFQLVYDF